MKNGLLKWLRKHVYEAHLLAFFLMIMSSISLYYSAGLGLEVLSWGLLTMVVLGNLIALWV